MTSPELLRFFNSEAREYLESISQILAAEGGFEAGAFVAAARALRGSATMARVPRIAEIALGMERVANAVRDGEVDWSGRLRRDLDECVDDLHQFVAAARDWTSEDDRSATRRIAALRATLPAGAVTPPTATAPAGATPIFIALQSAAIATDLEALVANPDNRGIVNDIVTRVRSLRGIAGVGDHPPLGEVADAVERSLRELAPDAFLRDSDAELLTAAAGVFRRASSDLRARGRFDPMCAEVDRFARAAIALESPSAGDAGPVVRIEELFFMDAGPHVVERGATPRRSSEARFRNEVVTRAEHLRRLVAEARSAGDAFTRERVRRDLRNQLVQLDEFARSYGAQQVAAVVSDAAVVQSFTDEAVLETIEAVALVLTTPGINTDEMERRLAIGERLRHTPPRGAPGSHVARPPSSTPAPPAAPSGDALRNLLGESLHQLASLEDQTLADPVSVDDDSVVPVESLLYRGSAALARARQLRDAMRSGGSVDVEALAELYDLLDLARAG